MRDGVLEAARAKEERRKEVQWCRDMDVWASVFREVMDAERSKTMFLPWTGTGKGDADRPNYKSRLVVRKIKKVMKNPMLPLQLNSTAECSFWRVQREFFSLVVGARHHSCTFPWDTSATSISEAP